MRSLLAIATVLFVTLFSLAGMPACAGTMQGSKEAMMEKGETMAKDGDMAKTDKGMMMSDKEMMEPETAMMKGRMAATRSAMLVGAGSHHATGAASVTKNHDGQATLTLAEIRVDKIPDGRVYLAKNGDYRTGIELGKLTQFSGTVAFQIPSRVHPEEYDSVVIWCKQFNVEIGRAFFEKALMKAHDAMMEKNEAMMEGDKGMTQ
jgi:hypothetical protein